MRYRQAILVSCQVPWDSSERFDRQVFGLEVRRFIALGFRDLYIFGTAGEGHAVDSVRFQEVVRAFREETEQEGITAMVGVIGLSTANVLERLTVAYSAGFRHFQISLPSWGVLDESETMRFFLDVCGPFPDCGFLHYNVGRSGRLIHAAEYRRLADAVPNLVATKNTGTTTTGTIELMRIVPDLQHFFGESMFPIGCMIGECSLLSSFGSMFPSRTWQFFEAGCRRQVAELFSLHAEYMKVAADVQRPVHGTDRMDGAYDKLWVRLGGVPMPLRLLSPYEGFSEEVFELCREILTTKYPEWMK